MINYIKRKTILYFQRKILEMQKHTLMHFQNDGLKCKGLVNPVVRFLKCLIFLNVGIRVLVNFQVRKSFFKVLSIISESRKGKVKHTQFR